MSKPETTDLPSGGCRWCGMHHGAQCPSVRAIEYFQDGVTVRRVEFHAPQPVAVKSFPGPWMPPYNVTSATGPQSTGEGVLVYG